jgi:hypothetical protein
MRGEKVILDSDIARLYGVETGMLVRAVKRNLDRFPPDFMFQLNTDEFENLRTQIVSSSSWGGQKCSAFESAFISVDQRPVYFAISPVTICLICRIVCSSTSFTTKKS